MDVREELRSLTRDAPRSAPGDGIEVFRRGRRRRVRRRAATGVAGVALVAIAAAIALPGTVPSGITIEDNIADQPDGEVEVDVDGEARDDVAERDEAPSAGDDRRDPLPEEAPAADPEPDVEEVTDDGEPAPTDEPEVSDVPPVGDDASSEDRLQEPTGQVALTLTDVRIGRHDGFDRVVLEVAGEGQVGWFITSGTEAYHQGSGEPVDVAGEAVLTVALRGMVMPPGEDAFGAERVGPPADAGAVAEVLVGNVFEGQHEVFIGTTQSVEFRVARLDAPQRLVIDVIHP